MVRTEFHMMTATKSIGPRNAHGQLISRECPRCGCGTLQDAGDGFWRCDGLKDPDDDSKPLEACDYTHEDGTEPSSS